MRILFANDGAADAGGVHRYIARAGAALAARGHEVAFAHLGAAVDPARTPLPEVVHFALGDEPASHRAVLERAAAWAPDVCFTHNMHALGVDAALATLAPTVKFMHGHFGTCASGTRTHRLPGTSACTRTLGAGCAVAWLPRRCGALRVGAIRDGLRWAMEQRALLTRYAALVTASGYMRAQLLRNGAVPAQVEAIPLFPTLPRRATPPGASTNHRVAFAGRMTALKGPVELVRATAVAQRRIGAPIEVVFAGEGPERDRCLTMGRELGVTVTAAGWLGDDALAELLGGASLLVMPSRWPEPFGLSGLDAAAQGIPAVAFDVGGIGDWLHDGVNGVLVPPGHGDVDALGEAIASLLGEPATLARMRTAAHARARELSLDRHVNALEALFRRVAHGVAAPPEASATSAMPTHATARVT